MPYATAAQLQTHLGADRYVALADRDRSGAADEAAVAQALDSASALVDSYCTRYLPLPTPYPPLLVMAVMDVATYLLAGNNATTDERTRYEDRIAWLRDVAAKRASIARTEGQEPVPGGDAEVDAPPSQMRHAQTRRIL